MTVASSHPNGLIPQPHGGALAPVWRKGQSGWPGRKTAGAYISEHYNRLAAGFESGEFTCDHLAVIAKTDPNANRRIAAVKYLESMGADMADFEPFLKGKASLSKLRASGVFSGAVKKASIRRDSEGGEHITLELRDSLPALDHVHDRTEGKPIARVEVARVDRDPDQVRQDLAALLAANPSLAEDVAAMLPVEAEAVRVIE